MVTVEIKGDIIPNDDQWIYDWLEWDATSPGVIKNAIAELQPGEELEVLINSGGGSVMAGQEIYSLLCSVKSRGVVQSLAGSAAGVAMAGCKSVEISPVGMIMIHNVWCSGVAGDYHQMDKASEMLKNMNQAMAEAYVAKTGKPMEEILELMDRETWITARQAVEYGFADKIIEAEPMQALNGINDLRLTDEIRQRVISEKAMADQNEKRKHELLKDLDFYGV